MVTVADMLPALGAFLHVPEGSVSGTSWALGTLDQPGTREPQLYRGNYGSARIQRVGADGVSSRQVDANEYRKLKIWEG
jgi:hypothetical protein